MWSPFVDHHLLLVDIQSLFIYKEISSFLNLKFTWKKMWSSFQLIGHSKDYMATVHSGYTNEMWPDFSVLLEYFLNIPQPKLEVDYLISGL